MGSSNLWHALCKQDFEDLYSYSTRNTSHRLKYKENFCVQNLVKPTWAPVIADNDETTAAERQVGSYFET